MRHEKEWYTCDRCGVNIESKFVYTLLKEDIEKKIKQIENKEEGIEVLYQDESLWLTQDAIAVLFDKSRSTITEHLQNIFQSQELQEDSVCRKFRRTASDGKSYATKYYKFAIRGYVVDKKRFEKYRIIQDRLFQSDFDKYQTDNLLDFDNEIES